MERKQLTIKYERGHSYNKWYEQTDLHCPNCGKQEVWIEDDGGDYYVGEDYFCLACKTEFNLPHLSVPTDDENMNWQSQQVFEGLKK